MSKSIHNSSVSITRNRGAVIHHKFKTTKTISIQRRKKELIFIDSHPHIKYLNTKVRELFAVQDYGLKEVSKIYKSKYLIIPKKPLNNLEAAEQWFNNNSTNNKATFKANIGAFVNCKLHKSEFNHITKNKPDQKRWQWINNLQDMLSKPSEVYFNFNKLGEKRYNFLSFYKDGCYIVITDTKLNIKTAFEVTVKDLINDSTYRRGKLIYKK